MAKVVNALKARQNFGELLNEVFYGKEVITIERAGKAMAVIMHPEEYQKWQRQKEKLQEALKMVTEEANK